MQLMAGQQGIAEQHVPEAHALEEAAHDGSSDNPVSANAENCDNEVGPNSEQAEVCAFDEAVQLRGLPFNSCVQHELAQNAHRVYGIAPGEGNRPIPLLTDEHMEEMANSEKFPTGREGFNHPSEPRTTKLIFKQYTNAWLLDVDGRFAKDPNYLSSHQYSHEHKQVEDAVNIQLRKTRSSDNTGVALSAGSLRNRDTIQNLVMKNRAYRHLKNIRGIPGLFSFSNSQER